MYGREFEIRQLNAQLELIPEDITLLVGPQNSGKSTVLRALAAGTIDDGLVVYIDGRGTQLTDSESLLKAVQLATAAAIPRLSAYGKRRLLEALRARTASEAFKSITVEDLNISAAALVELMFPPDQPATIRDVIEILRTMAQQAAPGGRRLIFFIDEADKFGEWADESDICLRTLMDFLLTVRSGSQ